MSAELDIRAVIICQWRGGYDTQRIARNVGWTEAQVYNFLAQRREG